MTDHDALYRAIVASPADDTPRLVYADWLEENGREEEAEFIRLECRLQTSSPDQPEYTEWLDRLEELRLWLRTHSPKQLKEKLKGGLIVDRGHEWWNHTERGFPRFLLVPHGEGRLGVKDIRRLAMALEKAFAIIPTRWVVVGFSAVEDLAEFLKQPVVAAIDDLTISTDDQTGDEEARIIADCQLLRNLRGLSLMFPFGEAGAYALGHSEHLGRLERLELYNTNQLTSLAVCSLGAGSWFHGIHNLTLADDLVTEAFEELCRFPSCPNMHSLIVSGNGFPVSTWQMFAQSKTFPQLTRLDLHGTDMSSGRMAALASANGFRLTSLDLSTCAIGNEGLRSLVAAPWIGSLRWLDLAYNRLGPTAVAAIARCRKFTELKYLNLTGNPIGVTGLRAIGRSLSLRNLTTLLLGHCSAQNGALLPAHFHEFLEKLDLPNLRRLDLSKMAIGARAARLLADEKFRRLTRLGLTKCKLTDSAISELLRSPSFQNLIELKLEENSLKTGVEPLTDRRILPRLSRCLMIDNPIPPDLCRKLTRRPGVIVPS